MSQSSRGRFAGIGFVLAVFGLSYLALEPTAVLADSGSLRSSSLPSELIAAVNAVGVGGDQHAAAIAALDTWMTSNASDMDRLLATLHAMSDANARGKNWLLMAASSLRNRIDDIERLKSELNAFFDDREHDPDARYFAFRQLIAPELSGDAQQATAIEDAMLDRSLDDPSLPLRFRAIAKVINDVESIDVDAAKIERLSKALPLARHPDHLKTISKKLDTLGVDVDLASELAMVTRWHVIAPFDNTDGIGFEIITPVETEYLLNADKPLRTDRPVVSGDEKLGWLTGTTNDAMGVVDLNPVFDNAKNAVAYAHAVIEIDGDQLAGVSQFQARLGCICANQAWVNGEMVLSNEVYHSGSSIDQYIGRCDLRPGRNTVLIKVCQNDQTEPWAQDFEFQFRLTDETGRGIKHTVVSPSP
ncbi:MAG: hypothetical protein AAF745_00695 [Planctomycetota bacterium]